jgi:hypothetical protein
MIDSLVIDPRFNGPPDSANGGYACGVLAEVIGPAARVNLRLPPPLDRTLTRERDGTTVKLLDGGAVVADGTEARPAVTALASPGADAASLASQRFAGRDPDLHSFPTCFVCGPRREHDGLRIFPGPVEGTELIACVWEPGAELAAADGTVAARHVWAALDCPSGFACMPLGSMTVLASMTAEVARPVITGREHVVAAWKLSSEGRKHRAASAIYDPEGECLALAEALWITLSG